MIALRNLIWIWTISYLIIIWWVKANSSFLRDLHEEKYDFLDYDFYQIAFYVIVLIGAPIIVVPIIGGEIYAFFSLLPQRIKIWFRIMRIRDKEVRKAFRKKLKNL